MNNLLYARLAKTNLSKNRQNILPYLLSCIGTVVMFFIMDTLAQGSGFDSMIGKDTILTVMGMGTYIIGLFAVIFLIYSNSFLTKRRKKEFGLFQILGMEKKHLAKILFFESLYLWAASLGIGILLGALFLMGAVMIIYYKQVSEGFDDRKRFQIMQKVGMSRKEIRQTIQSQVVTVFFLPLAVAVVHTMVAFPLTRRIMAMLNFPDSNLFLAATAITIAAFAVVYLIVYVLTARAYYKIVE